MTVILTPTEEHYLKRELLKHQLWKEFSDLNDKYALRRFGYPFTSNDPLSSDPKSPTSKVIKRVIKSPTSKISGLMDSNNNNKTPTEIVRVDFNDTDFPMMSFVLHKFVMSFPLLSRDLANDPSFWQRKVQVFFEHFMSMEFSDSFDRDEATKRRKIARKLSKVILLLFNSGIGSGLEVQYYTEDKFKFQDEGARERSKIEEFAIPTKQKLRDLVTNEPVYINNWDLNVISVVEKTHLPQNYLKLISNLSPRHKAYDNNSDDDKTIGDNDSETTSKHKSSWMKSALGIASAPTALFSKLSMSENKKSVVKPKHKYHFIIKARIQSETNPSRSNTIYCAKTYDDFKKLAHDLKAEYPGKDIPKLPHKNKKSISITTTATYPVIDEGLRTPKEKIISTFQIDDEDIPSISSQLGNDSLPNDNGGSKRNGMSYHFGNNEDIDDYDENLVEDEEDDEGDSEEFHDTVDTKNSVLPRERLRTSLRQYIRSLSLDEEISKCSYFTNFFHSNLIQESTFNCFVLDDIKNRELVDVNNLENQLNFQKIALDKSIKLQDSMTTFKESFLKDKSFLINLMREIKEKTKVEELSPLLRDFVEWCKIYLSSTIYQLFLGNDNSYEFYTQVKRLHRLMPYTVMSQIMRFTNPMAIMKGMIELFMAQPFGGNSLLQTMFSSVLTDDLKSQDAVIKALETKLVGSWPQSRNAIGCLKSTVFENESGKFLKMDEIHKETESTGFPMILVILIKCSEARLLSANELNEIMESYLNWKNHNESEDSNDTQLNKGVYFSQLKELFQLYLKENDKKLMRKLWQDPQLTQLLKSIFTMIYEPMVKIFKVARVDIALKNFEKFMNDLIKLMDNVINGQLGASTEFNVVEAINNLVTSHQNSFLEFVHDVYNNDSEGIFEGFVTWVLDIIDFLQNSKFGEDATRINFTTMLEESSTNGELVLKEIDNVIDQKITGRKLYQQLLQLKIDESEKNKTKSSLIDKNWEHISSVFLENSNISFGINEGELLDLDLDTKDYDYLHKDGEESLERKYQEILNRGIETTEIENLADQEFEKALKCYLNKVGYK
ncbi:hypothetical protein Kpol_387p3 [Vanderwaltozyma polyspora DSM 70294]|uniref:PX domain-containing protein n=1 Tax=Vanderwaltozyma polyspora (strain ATCC 22028 / DSM 70294 / BCRC 21397 / CBS 2163 / NBRC 10782 / NRRL Y-8283 / UCD 57-17) TaxID=436907 RepID=A7TRX2_VANPO|nr:uncharacterized protein Kpol_387p3 [Vanderwaltozyma polyspora DSM 70294]EDO14977.1 hypothetical protein Kpol_387p3 [Vanderwaltozyma polyspora DSM 70294]